MLHNFAEHHEGVSLTVFPENTPMQFYLEIFYVA